MTANKRKKQIQGKNRRFRGDVWLDEKVSGRTMNALREQGITFPAYVNPRKTQEFKDEYKKQLTQFRKDHAAKIATKKEAARAAQKAAAQTQTAADSTVQ